MSQKLPDTGTFKIETIGPIKEGVSKKGNAWKVYQIQFEGDPQWYGTFWTLKEDPEEGKELTGTKSYDNDYDQYKFEIERQGGKSNWNPAGANATVMLASVEIVNGFLAIGDHYELWEKGDKTLKAKFDKYLATVVAVIPRLKEQTISMGSLKSEEKTGESSSSNDSDPGPTPPPELDDIPADQEEVDI